MAASVSYVEVLPPTLEADSEPPALFNGTTRLYIAYICPYAQRVWIARNYKGLQEQIKLVPIYLESKPAWYKEKVYPPNKVPSLEHNNNIIGESLDLLKYLNDNFEGPTLLPDDPEKKQFAEELLSFCDPFNQLLVASMGHAGEEIVAAFDKLETALSKYDDGPFFLGQFSLVDIAFAPFVERFQPLYLDVENYDVADGRPNLAIWIEELNKIDAYTQTRQDPQELLGFAIARTTDSYKSAIQATEPIETPSIGFAKPSEYQGNSLSNSAIIKQNNTQIHLLIQIAESLRDIQTDLKTVLEQTSRRASSSTPAIPESLIEKLQGLTLGVKPKEGRGMLRVFKDPYKILEEEQRKARRL